MRYLFGFMCVLALGVMPMVGCGETEGTGGSGGSAGGGGSGGDGGTTPECESPEDCDDGNECTEDVCTDGECSNTAVTDRTECDFDGLPGLCMSGICEDYMLSACVPGCDDGNECTHDACDPVANLCEHTPVAGGTTCGGGPGICHAGSCACVCDDENLCTEAACDPADGICDYLPVDCDDGNECTDDACDAADGCSNLEVENGTVCGDGPGTCQEGSCVGGIFACSEEGIRAAIAVGGGPHTFDCIGPTPVVTDAEIVLDNDVILDGEGNLTVDGNESHRVFYVAKSVTAELRGFTVTRGAAGYGGGIRNQGALVVSDCTVSGNTGGGIANLSPGQMTITNSTVSGNTAAGGRGGIYNDRTMTLTNSTVSGNDGFGIANSGLATTTTLTNSTISGNSRGSLEVECVLLFFTHCGRFRLINSTLSGDTACLSASGFECDEPDGLSFATWTNTVIDGVCPETWIAVSNGYNIESPGDTCGFDQDTDQVDVTEARLNLGPLQDNGGPTMTHALLPGSVAIDVIPEAMCEVDTDQRGFPRDSMCDVGSFEVQPAP